MIFKAFRRFLFSRAVPIPFLPAGGRKVYKRGILFLPIPLLRVYNESEFNIRRMPSNGLQPAKAGMDRIF